MVEYVLARVVLRPAGQVAHVTDVRVGIDQRRDDSLAGEIDARCSRRRRHLAAAADCGEPIVLHRERGILDRPTAVAGDQPRPFE